MVSFLHTVLLCDKLDFSTALVVCPLNTALNWMNEFEKWQEGLNDDEKLEVTFSYVSYCSSSMRFLYGKTVLSY